MKKKLAAILSSVMVLTVTAPLAACGGGGDILNPDGTWWSTTGELNLDDGGNVVFDDVSIRLTTIVGGVDKNPFSQIIGQFNAEYRGKINIICSNVGEGEFESTVTRQLTQNAKNAPDVIMAHQKSLKSFYDYKVIQPYDLAMEETGVEIDLSGFAEGVNQYSNGGTEYQFGVPVDAASMVVYYNKDMLAEYTEKVPETRSELMKVCADYKAATNNTPISWETSGDFFAKYLMPTAVLQNGGYLYKDDFYGDWYDNETQRGIFKDAIKSVREFIDLDYAKLGVHEISGATDFYERKALFYVSMPWYRPNIVDAYSQRNNVTVSQAEDVIGGMSISGWFAMKDEKSENAKKIYGDSHMLSITRKVKDINQKAAICEFVRWFTQRADVGAAWAEAGHVTLSNTIANSDTYKNNKYVKELINNWYPYLDAFTPMGVTPYYMDVLNNLSSLLSEALIDGNPDNYESYIRTKQKALNSQIDLLKQMQ